VIPPSASLYSEPKTSFKTVLNFDTQAAVSDRPLLADCVEKLENRGTSKISQMMHVGDFSHRKVFRIDTSVSSRFCGI
jgi:hypothetical protein